MRVLTLIIFSIVTQLTGQSKMDEWHITGDVKNDILKLITKRKYEFYKMNTKSYSDSIAMQISIKEREIQTKYVLKVDQNGVVSNMTKRHSMEEFFTDYNNLENLKEKKQLLSTDVVICMIYQSDSIIRFEIFNNETILFPIELNFKNNVVLVDGQSLIFKDNMNVDSSNNIYKSKWKGYKWRSKSEDSSSNKLIGRYTFTIGQLVESRRIFMNVKKDEFYLGHRVRSINISLISKITGM